MHLAPVASQGHVKNKSQVRQKLCQCQQLGQDPTHSQSDTMIIKEKINITNL